MDALLNLRSDAVAYDDGAATSSPERNFFSWTRKATAVPVKNPKSNSYTLAPFSSVTVINGTRSTSIDGTTQLTMGLSLLVDAAGGTSTYRFTHSAGTAPVFRVARALSLNGRTVTVTVNSNKTVTMATQAGDWSALQVGDWVFVPGESSGDPAGPFDPINTGYWTVLGKAGDGSSVTLARFYGAAFEALAETPAVTDDSQVQAFGAAGVQIGDMVDISAGFSASLQRAFQVSAVNPEWFEVTSTAPLPTAETATPTASGIVFYSSSATYLRVEVDQEAAVRINGDTSDHNRVSPITPGDKNAVGWFEKYGPAWSLVVVNRSPVAMTATVIAAE
jgi:hypothetical protein